LQGYKRPEANVLATVDGVKDELPGLRNLVPPGTQITPYFDETSTIRNSVNDVQITLLISLSMVILTMALFLRRLAPTLIASAAVPMSLCGAFIVMYAMDYTLDNLSLLALVIALTFVVDDAIVVIENIIRHLDEGKPRLQAALEGAREIGFTIVAITASLLAVFMPILFAPSFIGMWFREFTVTIIAAIFVSMLVSLTLTPALCGAFIVMYAMDYTLDNLSLLALVIALTFVVDDAIVVIENIIRHLDEGKPRLQAALEGAREIGFTIIAITASLLAVFMPILFAPSFIGMWFREFTVTIIAAIFVSMVVSLTLTPALCGRFLRHHDHESGPSKLSRALDGFHAGMLSIYRRTLDWTLHKHPKLMAWSPLVLLAFTIYLFHVLPGTDFPPQDTGLIWGRASGEVTMSFADLEARTSNLVTMLRKDPAVEYVGASVGTSRRGPSGWFSIQLKPFGKERKDTTDQVVARLSAKVARYPDLDVRFRALQDLGGGGGGTSQGGQYSVNLQSNSATELEEWLPKLQAQLQKNPMFRDVGSDLDEGSLLQNMVVDRAKAATYGVSMAAVDDALYNAFGQRQISTIYSDTNQYQVVLSALPAQTASPAALDSLFVRSSSGKMVPISAIAHQESSTSPSEIEHINQMTSMSLSFNLAPGVSMGEATKEINKTIADMRMPGDIPLGLGDFFRRFEQQMAMMPLLLVGAIIAVYLVLGMLYENLVHPVTILSTLPAAGVGALLALKVTGLPLS
ncbi:MAG TPA: efflux RND transporter permease subunit, partial [Rhodanobacteraceae bacterium]|nr:efflux RND transporter permease subunit [Rhodanobacteraceae bacterium]